MSRYDSSIIADWLASRCVRSPDARTRTRELFESWRVWQLQRKRAAGAVATFSGMLSASGFQRFTDSYTGGFLGRMLRSEPTAASQIDRLLAASDAVAS